MYKYNFEIHFFILLICIGLSLFYTYFLYRKEGQKPSLREIILPKTEILKKGADHKEAQLLLFGMSFVGFLALLYPLGSDGMTNGERTSALMELLKVGIVIVVILLIYSRWLKRRK